MTQSSLDLWSHSFLSKHDISLFKRTFKVIFHDEKHPIRRGHRRALREGEVLRQFQGEVLVQTLDFPTHSIHFHFSLSSR